MERGPVSWDARQHATNIVKKLVKEGYVAYFAGGWVRDHIMNHPCQDIDIATNAPPEKILDLFPHTLLIGLAFGVVIVMIEGHQFEVSTFRRDLDYQGGRRPSQIELADAQQDALRRDFTINGLFYDPIEEVIHDFVHGIQDIKAGLIRTIGDPYERFFEDRLRMIRAVRFSSRFGFTIDPETQEGILSNADTLFPAVALERVWHEFNKMAAHPKMDHALVELHRLGLLPVIFPVLENVHLNEIKHRVSHFAQFPIGCPTIVYLGELFPEATDSDLMEMCQYLRTSKEDMKIALFIRQGKELVKQKDVDPLTWAYFYADPYAQLCLEVIAAGYPKEEREWFLQTHAEQQSNLQRHITRVLEKKPLVNATFLREQGIIPGKDMGTLMKEAEKISIRENLHDPILVLNRLKSMALWPKK
jgi:poly(A) polymerase